MVDDAVHISRLIVGRGDASTAAKVCHHVMHGVVGDDLCLPDISSMEL